MKTTGTLIRFLPLTETSLILHWSTAEYGMVKTVAKGARRANSSFSGKTDLFYHCDLVLQRANRGDLHWLKELEVLDRRLGLRRNYLQTVAASYFVKCIDLVAELDTPIPELSDLLERALNFLSEKDVTWRAVLHFETQLVEMLGIQERTVPAHRTLLHHFHRLPPQREELASRLAMA